MGYPTDLLTTKDLHNHLKEQSANGFKWVVYDTDNPIRNQFDLTFFQESDEASVFAKEYQQIFNWHEAVPIENLIYEMKERETSQLAASGETELDHPNSTLKTSNINMDETVNRAKLLWENWERQEKQIEGIAGVSNDRNSLKYKYEFLSNGLHRLSESPNESEKLFMQALKTVTAKLQKQLYPKPLQRLWHNFKTFIIDKPAHIESFKRNKSENLASLNSQFKTSGLHHLTENLANKLDYESPKIALRSISGLKDNNRVEVRVDLEKEKLGSYRFNGFNVTLSDGKGESKSYDFSAESKITLKEAVNLLQGRPVYKSYENADGTKSQRWIQMDKEPGMDGKFHLLTYPNNHDFNLKDTLLRSGVELDFYAIAKEPIRRGLEAGNKVEFQINGKGRFSITADPSSNKIEIFDANKNSLSVAALKKIIHPIKENKNKETNIIQQKDVQQETQMRIIR